MSRTPCSARVRSRCSLPSLGTSACRSQLGCGIWKDNVSTVVCNVRSYIHDYVEVPVIEFTTSPVAKSSLLLTFVALLSTWTMARMNKEKYKFYLKNVKSICSDQNVKHLL